MTFCVLVCVYVWRKKCSKRVISDLKMIQDSKPIPATLLSMRLITSQRNSHLELDEYEIFHISVCRVVSLLPV